MQRKVSFHGHSRYSDGHSSIRELVEMALLTNIDYFGISDHETTSGVEKLYEEIQVANEIYKKHIIPIAACEIHPKEGEVIVAKPGSLDHEFLKWASSLGKKKIDSITAIKRAILDFDALVVIPHGGDKKAKGISFDDIKKIIHNLDQHEREYFGLEVHNWSMRLFWRESRLREKTLEELCKKYKLARLGFSDFHESWVIAEQYSVFEGNDAMASADELYGAFKKRMITPAYSTIDKYRYMRLVKSIGRAFIRTHTPPSFKKML